LIFSVKRIAFDHEIMRTTLLRCTASLGRTDKDVIAVNDPRFTAPQSHGIAHAINKKI